jgi:hypothetical protein
MTFEEATVEEALAILYAVLQSDCLNDTHELVFRCAWGGQTDEEIALAFNYDGDYLRHVGFQLWRSLSEALGKKVTKKNFRSVLMQQQNRILDGQKNREAEASFRPNFSSQDWDEVIDVSFVYEHIAKLDILKQWLVSDRYRLIILLEMDDGIGKKTLAVSRLSDLNRRPTHYK